MAKTNKKRKKRKESIQLVNAKRKGGKLYVT